MASDHIRNTAAMLASPRCGAKTRKGTTCNAPSVSGRQRCRMHGGAQGSGAPIGNKNALRSGVHTREMIEQRRQIGNLIRLSRKTIGDIG